MAFVDGAQQTLCPAGALGVQCWVDLEEILKGQWGTVQGESLHS
jgi:hypothetical protein